MIPSPEDPADPADPVHGLPLGTSPTRAGGQDDVSSQANSLKLRLWLCILTVVIRVGWGVVLGQWRPLRHRTLTTHPGTRLQRQACITFAPRVFLPRWWHARKQLWPSTPYYEQAGFNSMMMGPYMDRFYLSWMEVIPLAMYANRCTQISDYVQHDIPKRFIVLCWEW